MLPVLFLPLLLRFSKVFHPIIGITPNQIRTLLDYCEKHKTVFLNMENLPRQTCRYFYKNVCRVKGCPCKDCAANCKLYILKETKERKNYHEYIQEDPEGDR